MNRLSGAALAAYYWCSQPWRPRVFTNGSAPVCVLFYHRVADDTPNDWTISTRLFARQLDWLAQRFEFVSLAEAQRRIADGRNERPTITLTFDDGYADNSQFALPLLVERGIPTTYFVAWDFVLSGRPFPHDAARGQPLAPHTLDDLRRWAAAGIDIGAHTRRHADCGAIADRDVLYDEIVTAGRELAAALQHPVRYFAFPYGLPANMPGAAFEMAREAGYAGVCSAYGGYNLPGDDPFHLQRIHGDADLLRFKNWLTFDPRKFRRPRYDYRAAATSLASVSGSRP